MTEIKGYKDVKRESGVNTLIHSKKIRGRVYVKAVIPIALKLQARINAETGEGYPNLHIFDFNGKHYHHRSEAGGF